MRTMQLSSKLLMVTDGWDGLNCHSMSAMQRLSKFTYVDFVVLVPVGQVKFGVVLRQAEKLPLVVGAGNYRVLDLTQTLVKKSPSHETGSNPKQ